MVKDNSFHKYIIYDVLHDIQGISSKGMFGGWGIYKDGKIFAIIVEGELYFKESSGNKKYFEHIGSHKFSYDRNGKTVEMAYWLVPEELLENRQEIRELLEISIK